MRLTSTLAFSSLCCTFQSVCASTAQVYTYDPQSQPRTNVKSRSLSPVQARVVLAQRAGVEDYHIFQNADSLDKDTIDAINDFGARTTLFADKKSDVKKAFIFLEGDNSETSTSSLRPYQSFEVDPIPGADSSRDLFVDLAKESDPQGFLKLSDADLVALLKDSRIESSQGYLFHIASSAADLSSLFTSLAETKHWSVTALVVPQGSSSSSASWGTYLMPDAQSPLKKRQTSSSTQETPLVGGNSAQEFSPAQPATVGLTQESSTPSPLAGILPACFSSQNECEERTRNCTGHGSCSKKYHDPQFGSKAGGYACYSCACQASKSEDGKSTTYWAGPACQKKDVSVEFWLIALFTVGLVGLVSFAVGSVWEMGSEQLPSVIGAGVSGTGARK